MDGSLAHCNTGTLKLLGEQRVNVLTSETIED